MHTQSTCDSMVTNIYHDNVIGLPYRSFLKLNVASDTAADKKPRTAISTNELHLCIPFSTMTRPYLNKMTDTFGFLVEQRAVDLCSHLH